MKRPLLDPRIKPESHWRGMDAELERCRDRIERPWWVISLMVAPFIAAVIVSVIAWRIHP